MGRSWLLSSLLHTALATLLWFGLPSWGRSLPAMEGAITVELVTEAPDDARPPEPAVAALAPEPEREAARPPPPRREPEPKPAPPVAAPEPPTPPAPQPSPVAAPIPEPPPPPAPAPQPVAEPAPEPPAPPVVEPAPPPEPQVEPPPPPEPEKVAEPAPAPKPEPQPVVAKPEPPPQTKPAPKQQAALEPEPRPQSEAPSPKPQPPSKPQVQPKPAPPAPPKQAAKLEPPKPEPAKPAPEPQEEDPLAWLRSVEETIERKQAESERAGAGRSLADAAGQARTRTGESKMTQGERDALYHQITRNWILPRGAEGIEDVVVQLRVVVGPDRTVRRIEYQDAARMERDPTFRAVAESAYRAVERSSPLQLPPDKYSLWRDLMLNFNPRDLIGG
jgi:hypothetical protein